MDSSPQVPSSVPLTASPRDRIGACHAASAWPIAVLSIAEEAVERSLRKSTGVVMKTKASGRTADPVASLFRKRAKTTAPGSAQEVWIGIDTHKNVNVAAAVDEAGP